MINVKITERGWGGHFICASRCNFRRNTLVEGLSDRVVVSTVGNMKDPWNETEMSGVGYGGDESSGHRYYETMVFGVELDGSYLDAKVEDERRDYEGRWAICAESPDDLPDDVDNVANDMHEAAVAFYVELLRNESL